MDYSISIAKAIGIILMVIGHSGCPEYIHDFIYMFHMPLFFFLSGLCFKDKYITHTSDFLLRRIKGLYVPFVLIALLFLLLHNPFLNLGLIQGEYYELDAIYDRAKSIIFSLHKEEQLLGGFWFIPQLLYASVFFIFVLKLLRVKWLSLLLLIFLAVLFHYFNVTIPYTGIGFVSFYGAVFMMWGYILKDKVHIGSRLLLLVLFIIVVNAALLFPSDIFIDKINVFFPYMFAAIIGSIVTITCADRLLLVKNRKLQSILVFLGNNTLYVLTLHFLSFKLVSLFLISIGHNGLLSDFPVIGHCRRSWYWMLYSFVGIGLPMLVAFIVNKVTMNLNKD